MKANEAPEKIYIFDNPILDFTKLSVRQGSDDVEYTRTDAFIDKACVWIKENLLKHTYVYEGEVGIVMAVFLEEFKQAMKGE